MGCVPSLLLDLRPNYGGNNEDNGDLLQKVPCMHCYTLCPQSCSRPPLTHVSAGDSWILPGKSGLVSCGATAPFSWVLVQTRFCCALQESISQSCLSSGSSMVRLMATSSKRFYAIPKSAASRALSLWQSTADPYLHKDAQTQFCLSLCGGLWVLVCTRFV